jgi:hypothetical protein
VAFRGPVVVGRLRVRPRPWRHGGRGTFAGRAAGAHWTLLTRCRVRWAGVLACWLADRDGWRAPQWTLADDRLARPWWFASSSAYGRAWAMVQSPAQFRIRGVFITETALQRV